MLQIEESDTFVLATGRTVSVRDFVSMSAAVAGFDLVWEGKADRELGIDRSTGRTIVRVNPRFYRPAEVDLLVGNAEKARRILGWKPETSLEELSRMMVESDLRRIEQGRSY